MKTKNLYEKLRDYARGDAYPYHMPGHKRRVLGELPAELLEPDITEIDGFDNLHQPEGILRELQAQANRLYGADATYYLVNGSTAGILTAVSAAVPMGGHLLIARGSHKSVYHAAYLRRAELSYLYEQSHPNFAFPEPVTAAQAEEALERHPDINAVLIVSPTYEGRIADVRAIADVVHAHGLPLIVDEAHGAHLGFAEGFAPGSCAQGADLVIHSVHKTLPAMTQTALLHICGDRVDRDRVERYLHIYQSSSPSYVLMASIADAMNIVENSGTELFAAFRARYRRMLERLAACKCLRFVPWSDIGSGCQDIGKLVISGGGWVTGQWLYGCLRERYHLQCEMAAGDYCLAMFTLADGDEAYERMVTALSEIDAELAQGGISPQREDSAAAERSASLWLSQPAEPEIAVPFAEAWDMPTELTRLSDAAGRISGVFVNLYPPGTPLVVPGEVLTGERIGMIRTWLRQGLRVQGITGEDEGGEPTYRIECLCR